MYANFAPDDARQPDVIHTLFFTFARQHCGHLQRNIYTYIYTRNTGLAKPHETGAGWKALFTRIVASNEEHSNYFDEHGLLEVPQASLICG